MSFNLGLEALSESQYSAADDVLSYEFLDTVMQFNNESAEAVVIADGISSLCTAYENLTSICEVLSQHGNSPALEALVGGNFREGFSMEAAENAKKGLWATFVKWLKNLWIKVKAFFTKFISSADSMKTKLRERAQELSSPDVEMGEVDVELPKPDVLSGINDDIKKEVVAALQTCGHTLAELKANKLTLNSSKSAEEFDTFLKQKFGKPGETVKVSKADAIKMLNTLADHLQALSEVKNEVYKTCDDLQKASFSIDEGDIQGAGQAARETAKAAGEKKAKQEEAASNAETIARYDASDDRRAAIMKMQSAATKLIQKATSEAIRRGAVCLAAFKPHKVAK